MKERKKDRERLRKRRARNQEQIAHQEQTETTKQCDPQTPDTHAQHHTVSITAYWHIFPVKHFMHFVLSFTMSLIQSYIF